MRQYQLREILPDVDIACAIAPVVRKHHMTAAATAELLTTLAVPRAASVAGLIEQSV